MVDLHANETPAAAALRESSSRLGNSLAETCYSALTDLRLTATIEGSASSEGPAVDVLEAPALGGSVVLVVLAAVLGLLLAASWWSWWRRYASFRRMELAMPGPLSLPVLGSAHCFAGINEDNVFATALAIWGGRNTELSRVSIFNSLIVFVSDPDHIGKVVRDRKFNDKPWLIYSPMSDVLGDGLVTSSGALWKRHRTLVQPTFHLEVLERFVDVFAEEAAGFAARLASMVGRDVEFAEEMHQATANSVLRTTLSSTIEDGEREDLTNIVLGVTNSVRTVNTRSMNPLLWSTPIFKLTAKGREQSAYIDLTHNYMNRIIKRKTKEILSRTSEDGSLTPAKLGFKERKTFLDLVLEGTLSGQMNFSHEEMKNECLTIFGTAVETSVTALTFVFKMLSIRPDVQSRVYAELQDVFGGSKRLVTCEDLPRLTYMERVIKETLRIFPIGPFVARQVHEETELAGKQLPAGTWLVVNIFSAHRDARFHPDPLHFDPDRFLPERTANWHPHCYMPFSAGPRNCIGQRYAMMQMKTILSTTLRHYSIQPAQDGITHPSQFPLTFDIALRLVGGTKVRFEHRAAADAA